MDKRIVFYGTPLTKLLDADRADDEGPVTSRRHRLNLQQTVRDDQGRQRFHGAFTGGFSAGYFNTVGTKEGFRPRQYVTHRASKTIDSSGPSGFSHRPEDYMDEEDLGEFGIAPKKIRVSNQYSTNNDSSTPSIIDGSRAILTSLVQPAAVSIGDRILKRMSGESNSRQNNCDTNRLKTPNFVVKSDYHGLGYKTLSAREMAGQNVSSTPSNNPLSAVLGGGKRLKISGEAFGSGVLDDDEDYLESSDAYGYDDPKNYDFGPRNGYKMSKSTGLPPKRSGMRDHNIEGSLDGFVPGKEMAAVDHWEKLKVLYPPTKIPESWRLPKRVEKIKISEYAVPVSAPNLQFQGHQSSAAFNQKFVSASSSKIDPLGEIKSGLVQYSDLKAVEPERTQNEASHYEPAPEEPAKRRTITRLVVEWRPCSLLSKRFNVPNPFPGSQITGVKLTNLIESCEPKPIENESTRGACAPVSMELKRSIFNMFASSSESRSNDCQDVSGESDEEDAPQVVHLDTDDSEPDMPSTNMDSPSASNLGEPDILLVPVPKVEPEVIELISDTSSSKSSDSSAQPSSSTEQRKLHPKRTNIAIVDLDSDSRGGSLAADDDEDDDAYGPPLPPTRRTLNELASRLSELPDRRSSLGKHKKSKKQKKKRQKDKNQ